MSDFRSNCDCCHEHSAHLSPVCIVSPGVLPFADSSLLIRVAAAVTPIKTAKIGSATLDMIYVGTGILIKGDLL